MSFLDDPIKQRTTLLYKRSKTKCRVFQDRQDVRADDPITQRTTLVYTRYETNVEYTKIDRMFVQTIRLNREQS
jgi:hypothetical protein